ncbi:MAG: hypothetical protein ABI781_01555 [Burkholderiales bacterium]
MSRRIRFLLMCLIALALPVQGIAAATMLHCDHAQHAAATVASNPRHDHRHDHAAHKAAVAEKASCSACAACCLGAGITAPHVVLPAPLAAFTVLHAAAEPAWVGTILAVPKRPPRHLLA